MSKHTVGLTRHMSTRGFSNPGAHVTLRVGEIRRRVRRPALNVFASAGVTGPVRDNMEPPVHSSPSASLALRLPAFPVVSCGPRTFQPRATPA